MEEMCAKRGARCCALAHRNRGLPRLRIVKCASRAGPTCGGRGLLRKRTRTHSGEGFGSACDLSRLTRGDRPLTRTRLCLAIELPSPARGEGTSIGIALLARQALEHLDLESKHSSRFCNPASHLLAAHFASELCINIALYQQRGRREGRVAACTRGSRARQLRKERENLRVQAVTTGLPCAMVYGL